MINKTKLEKMPEETKSGIQTIYQIPLRISVEDGSFLHIGGSPSPLTEKKSPVFSVDGIPVIPATSFKGAFRYQTEQLLISRKDIIKSKFAIIDDDLIKPCIPAPRPSKGEKELLNTGYSECCSISIEENSVKISKKLNKDVGICPVCYFFGSNSLMGYLKIPNFFPEVGDHKIDQTNIRIDRKSGTAAPGAIVQGEQVKPGTSFFGILEIISPHDSFKFGKVRSIGGIKTDIWLEAIASKKDIKEVQLLLLNEILLPALDNVSVLGGQKSKGAGKISIKLE